MGDRDSLTLKVREYVFGLRVAKMVPLEVTKGVGGAGDRVGTEGEEIRLYSTLVRERGGHQKGAVTL